MNKFKTTLLRIVGRFIKMASYLTAIGSLVLSIGVLLVVEIPNSKTISFAIIIFGLVLAIIGLIFTIREEQRNQREHKLMVRREKSNLIVLAHIAEGLGVDMNKVVDMLEDKLDDK